MSPASSPGRRTDALSPSAPVAPMDDWPAQAADTIERVVGSVRDKTTGPAITAVRWAVYGTFAVIVGTAVAVMLAIAAVRILDVYLPDAWVGEDHTWAAHLIVGVTFTLFGMWAWSKRSGSSELR